MFDKERLKDALLLYKKDFAQKQWPDEKYKWEAVQWFQDHWDVNASDFSDMLTRSLAKTANLLASQSYFPARMIKQFADGAPEEVRATFVDLFDESKDVYERIEKFKETSHTLLGKYGNGAGRHYQTENAISTYLWLRYPDKYYIYKFGEIRTVASELGSDYSFKKGDYVTNIRNFLKLYNEVCTELQQDDALKQLLKSQLTPSCYTDPELRTLTIDVGFYISRSGREQKAGHEETSPPVLAEALETYIKENFLNEVYMAEDKYDRLVSVLKHKKNVILQGAPGVGKTFGAKRLAYSLMGVKDESRIEFIQFHQNYSYEDFMMGYKPAEDGFELKYGIFYRFCQKAANQPDKDHFFIIDEINRGNMSKIFGELLMLIERDYRGTKVTLAYNGHTFSVPENLHIIGLMNTADRSLAMVDYALRRRFSFFEMEPGFDSKGFIKYREGFSSDLFNALIAAIKDLNKEISQDPSLGKGFCIGHSYFREVNECTSDWLKEVVEYDILPMLGEYWFDDEVKRQRWENVLHEVFL